MSEYDNTNRVSIWGNRDKREGKQDADYTGTVNVEGKEYFINLWKRKPDANPKSPALSGNIKAKDKVNQAGMDQAKAAAQPDNAAPSGSEFDSDDIPF
jgi:hypothetical protein